MVNTDKCGCMSSMSEKMQRLKSAQSQISARQPAVPRISGFGCHGKVVSFLQSSEVCGSCGSVVVGDDIIRPFFSASTVEFSFACGSCGSARGQVSVIKSLTARGSCGSVEACLVL